MIPSDFPLGPVEVPGPLCFRDQVLSEEEGDNQSK